LTAVAWRIDLEELHVPSISRALALSAVLVTAPAVPAPAQTPAAGGSQQPAAPGRGAQPPEPGQARGRRASPPQPQQQQGLDYFVGSWTFEWTGRESPVTPGPRSGSVTFTRAGAALDVRSESKLEDGTATFNETGALEWDAAGKVLTIRERLSDGTSLLGTGNWSSPLAIRYESEPVRVGNQTLRLRRSYAILSAHSYSVAEELSIDGGAFVRLGNGVFTKQ
jgi:hypothetical protein